MLDFLSFIFKGLFYTAAALFLLLGLPFVIAHVVDHWDAPEYPYSGFTPDCPTWSEPADEVENTLPPTYSLAADSER